MVGTCLDFATCTLDHIVNVEAHRFKFNLPSTKVKLGTIAFILENMANSNHSGRYKNSVALSNSLSFSIYSHKVASWFLHLLQVAV